MEIKFSILSNMRTYGIELRERNYPTFEGKYNAYVACYGQLSGNYLGCIDIPLAMDINESDAANLIADAEKLIFTSNRPAAIW